MTCKCLISTASANITKYAAWQTRLKQQKLMSPWSLAQVPKLGKTKWTLPTQNEIPQIFHANKAPDNALINHCLCLMFRFAKLNDQKNSYISVIKVSLHIVNTRTVTGVLDSSALQKCMHAAQKCIITTSGYGYWTNDQTHTTFSWPQCNYLSPAFTVRGYCNEIINLLYAWNVVFIFIGQQVPLT